MMSVSSFAGARMVFGPGLAARAQVALPTLLSSILLTTSLWAQVPKTEGEIPLYQGATRDAAAEAARINERAAAEAEQARNNERAAAERGERPISASSPISRTLKVYRVNAPIEDVVRFYRQRLGDHREPNRSSPQHSIHFHDFDAVDEFENCPMGAVEITAADIAKIRSVMTRGRPPLEPGKWVSDANWEWGAQDAEGKGTQFRLSLSDVGLSSDCKSWSPKTEIEITVEVFAAPEEPRPLSQPTERDLGVPIYPGAKYDAEHSGSSPEEGTNHVYLTNDPQRTVTQFYERQTGKQAQIQPDGSGLIMVRPGEMLIIMANTMLGGPFKTVITVSITKPEG